MYDQDHATGGRSASAHRIEMGEELMGLATVIIDTVLHSACLGYRSRRFADGASLVMAGRALQHHVPSASRFQLDDGQREMMTYFRKNCRFLTGRTAMVSAAAPRLRLISDWSTR